MGGRNHEGYPDPTASIAMGMVAREEKKKRREESQEEKKKRRKSNKKPKEVTENERSEYRIRQQLHGEDLVE